MHLPCRCFTTRPLDGWRIHAALLCKRAGRWCLRSGLIPRGPVPRQPWSGTNVTRHEALSSIRPSTLPRGACRQFVLCWLKRPQPRCPLQAPCRFLTARGSRGTGARTAFADLSFASAGRRQPRDCREYRAAVDGNRAVAVVSGPRSTSRSSATGGSRTTLPSRVDVQCVPGLVSGNCCCSVVIACGL